MDGAQTPLAQTMNAIGARARAAATTLRLADAATRTRALQAMAGALARAEADILAANARDVAKAQIPGQPAAFIDRLALDGARFAAIVAAVYETAALPDPVGEVIASWTRPNGLAFERVRTPLGVIGIIFESRPNVAADAGALCVRAGNAVILRGGADSVESVAAIGAALRAGLREAGAPEDAIQIVPTTDRAAVGMMLSGLDGAIDVIVPRGGKSLVARVQAEARVPVFAHLEGVNHTYVHASADRGKAVAVVVNAKMRRVSVCGATEKLLIDRAVAPTLLPEIARALAKCGCELRGDAEACAIFTMTPASADDWRTEYLAPILTVHVVGGVNEAIEHIAFHGSQHTDAIITEDQAAAEQFLREVDSAIVLHNASTQFADGGEFGFGGEIGIATGRLHARGPVGAEQLTTFKYVVRGAGQTRP
ncbi:MAG: glutamate-5-semialdehyde dehydrogenase [Hyphomonadaceae bacterium]|nr:glutamate-5-semialdehyde dehydrogenase [Hyphomonadaceae bacterium]